MNYEKHTVLHRRKTTHKFALLLFMSLGKLVLWQFVNGFKKDIRELSIRQDDLLKTPV